MLQDRNLVVDTFSDVYQQLLPWRTHEFWNLAEHDLVPHSIYVIGRKQFIENTVKILGMIGDDRFLVVFDNIAEGSWTLTSHLQAIGIDDYARRGEILIIAGADIGPEYRYITFEHFLSCIFDYEENREAIKRTDEIYLKRDKPFNFLFLNGRARPHRKYLYERLRQKNLLDRSIWTMLDGRPSVTRHYDLHEGEVDLMATVSEIRCLPSEYEYRDYRESVINIQPAQRSFVKHDLFSHTWGEIYLQPEAYIDSYFSLVTETVCEHTYSFRTEKIAKPLAMGHPFIVAASSGFYRDLKKLGFRTFGHVIDESFDQIENSQARMDRIIQVVTDLCNEDLNSFLTACEEVCKYNQQYLNVFAHEMRRDFPGRFFQFLNTIL